MTKQSPQQEGVAIKQSLALNRDGGDDSALQLVLSGLDHTNPNEILPSDPEDLILDDLPRFEKRSVEHFPQSIVQGFLEVLLAPLAPVSSHDFGVAGKKLNLL